MLKISRTLQACNRAVLFTSKFEPSTTSCSFNRPPPYSHVQIRCLSVGDIFGKLDISKVANIPDAPLPIPPKLSVEELASTGQSVLNELGLFSWVTPPSYIRWALESMHLNFDIPWWTTIVIVSTSLRLLTIYVPIASQRMVALQSRYKPEMKEFKDRITDARAEGDAVMTQQILIEQNQFLKSKGINMIKQAGVTVVNGAIFFTNFLAIKKMAGVSFPGFENGGALWFTNLLETDPYMVLPFISAATTYVVLKIGIDSGISSDQMTPAMKIGMQYGFPAVIFISGWFFSSAICVHWVTSNTFSLILAALFKSESVRNALKIPPIVKYEGVKEVNAIRELWTKSRNKKKAPPTLASLRKNDYEKFKEAGRGKPIV